jgi:BirA family biotin operon repressor/biotin-[acetyl-CoA-carboxylase] ligase
MFDPRSRLNFGDMTFRFARLSSTMDFARRLAQLQFPEGTAVLADEQTAGRGTKGRSWHSARGKGLYVSFILRPSSSFLNLLPLTLGLASAEAIYNLSRMDVQLKWPNDLVFQGKKIGGILCEAGTSGRQSCFTVAGIGINLNHGADDFPRELSGAATSLFILTGKAFEKESLLSLLGQSLQFWYNKLKKRQVSSVIEQYEKKLCFTPGKKLIIRNEDEEIEGQFQGIDRNGGLKLKLGQEVKTFYASEIIKFLS